jgi:predicted metal-dependent enzyme (double-stranded beta helix superfamily)
MIMREAAEALGPFVAGVNSVLALSRDEAEILTGIEQHMRELVATDDWLPETHEQSRADAYQQHLLYLDPAAAFSVVSFVWGPGQKTPLHDHTVWGVVGIMRGEEISHDYRRSPDGGLEHLRTTRLACGDVTSVGPETGDIHLVQNALQDRPSISIHVYGADIGRIQRHAFDLGTGAITSFVSGYSATPALSLPTIEPRQR